MSSRARQKTYETARKPSDYTRKNISKSYTVFLFLRMAAAKFIKMNQLRNELLVVESAREPEHIYLHQKQKHKGNKGNIDFNKCHEFYRQNKEKDTMKLKCH